MYIRNIVNYKIDLLQHIYQIHFVNRVWQITFPVYPTLMCARWGSGQEYALAPLAPGKDNIFLLLIGGDPGFFCYFSLYGGFFGDVFLFVAVPFSLCGAFLCAQ